MIENSRYAKLVEELHAVIPEERLIRDELRLFACSTDASFYRLIPKLIVQVASERDVVFVIRACSELNIPYTFRAAGTSLSGQAVSDSVLIQVHRLWNDVEVTPDGKKIRCAPAVLGGDANRALAKFGRKIGPDPASIDSAMIGGIAANNSSGMCCGNVQDTYHTIASARIVFSDGTVLDTGSSDSRRRLAQERQALLGEIEALAKRVKADTRLAERIRWKYRIKNTTGYSLHALIDFDDPIDIIEHLLIGSEGTLGFISQIEYETVVDHPYRATSLILFPHIHAACQAARRLSESSAAAVELMDRHSLRSVETKAGIPEEMRTLPGDACALLVELRAETEQELRLQVEKVDAVLQSCALLDTPEFTRDKLQAKRLWDIRKGLFPSLGYSRKNGTTIIIEDVAFPLEVLADAALELRTLFEKYQYGDAVIFGHALQGNLHFVFCVDFQVESEVLKYAAFLADLVELVSNKYGGSLKAEHGTGRNMAPFVESEWGSDAFAVMREIKRIFDPKNLLNPGVILNANPQAHVSHLKQTPPSHPVIEKCTECGFCERTCPSRNLSLTPRQRIAVWREISHLSAGRQDEARRRRLRKQFDYAGEQTCAVDGLCAGLCPVGINTGTFIKELRRIQHGRWSNMVADTVARHFAGALSLARGSLRAARFGRAVIGVRGMRRMSALLRSATANSLPQWNAWVPEAAKPFGTQTKNDHPDKVVYFSSCVSRLFGPYSRGRYEASQQVCMERLLDRGRYTPIYPENLDALCCGMAFASKGFSKQADAKLDETLEKLGRLTQGGRYPVLVDASPCAQRLKSNAASLDVYDVAAFLWKFVAPRVPLKKLRRSIAVHVPCSARNTVEHSDLVDLAKMCADDVFIPESTPCCGFAGDRGFTHPELTASALVTLRAEMPRQCEAGYSTSRTCEIGLSLHSGISYQSIAYLAEEAADAAQ